MLPKDGGEALLGSGTVFPGFGTVFPGSGELPGFELFLNHFSVL